MKDHGFGFLGESSNKKRKSLGDVGGNVLKRFSGVDCSDFNVIGWSGDGDRNKDGPCFLS